MISIRRGSTILMIAGALSVSTLASAEAPTPLCDGNKAEQKAPTAENDKQSTDKSEKKSQEKTDPKQNEKQDPNQSHKS